MTLFPLRTICSGKHTASPDKWTGYTSSGTVTFDGKDIYETKDKELSAFRRRKIGFIFQQFNLLPVLTAKKTS